MARTSTINIRRTSRGTTIRATGGAAQALCDAITGAATTAKAATQPPRKYVLTIRTEWVDIKFLAWVLVGSDTDEEAVGLVTVAASSSESDRTAVQRLLALATPPLHVVRWGGACPLIEGVIDYTVIAEAL